MCESLFCWCSFPPNLQLSPVLNTWMSCQRYPWIARPSVPGTTTWTLALRLGGMETKIYVDICVFLFRVSDVPSWDPIYLWYIIYIHILFTWCIYMTWYYLYTYTFTQHSDFFPTFWTAGPLTKVRYQKHGSFGELFLFFSGRKWGQNCKVKRWNCSAGATAVPSREPPWEKENHLQKVPLGGDMLVFRRADVSRFFVWLNPYWSSFPNTIFQGLCLFGGV